MEKNLGSSFKRVKAKCYLEHKEGFYIYAKPTKCDPKVVTKYIGRYLGRPVIATSHIDKYDGENVTFHYNRHEDDQLVVETIPVMGFISRLIQHIPEKHFKQIRNYGLYARNRENDKKIHLAIAKEKRKILLSFNRWRDCTLSSFGYDPLKLDMDYFLTEDDEFGEDFPGAEGFYIFYIHIVYLSCPLTCGPFSYLSIPKLELSYKEKDSVKSISAFTLSFYLGNIHIAILHILP